MYNATLPLCCPKHCFTRLCLLASNDSIVVGHFAVFLVGAASLRSVFYCYYYSSFV